MFDRVGDGQVMVKFWSWEGTEGDGMVINTKSCGQTSLKDIIQENHLVGGIHSSCFDHCSMRRGGMAFV